MKAILQNNISSVYAYIYICMRMLISTSYIISNIIVRRRAGMRIHIILLFYSIFSFFTVVMLHVRFKIQMRGVYGYFQV